MTKRILIKTYHVYYTRETDYEVRVKGTITTEYGTKELAESGILDVLADIACGLTPEVIVAHDGYILNMVREESGG